MNENDLKIRKQWLTTYLISLVVGLIYSWLAVHAEMPTEELPGWTSYLFIGTSVLGLGFGYLFYHCAYKKPGTKLLTFCLVMFWVGLAYAAISWIFGGEIPLPKTWYCRALYLFQTGLSIPIYFLNLKMRKINKQLQANLKLQKTV